MLIIHSAPAGAQCIYANVLPLMYKQWGFCNGNKLQAGFFVPWKGGKTIAWVLRREHILWLKALPNFLLLLESTKFATINPGNDGRWNALEAFIEGCHVNQTTKKAFHIPPHAFTLHSCFLEVWPSPEMVCIAVYVFVRSVPDSRSTRQAVPAGVEEP